jgi:hypothetical protein
MSITDYQSPVAELLNYGDCRNHRKWCNYIRELNLEAKHIPELIKMATDEELSLADSDSKEVWSPVHAWRALGQLKAVEALKPLLGLLNNDDDWISSDFPTLCTLIGKDSIPLLKEFLADSTNNLYARSNAAECLKAFCDEYPEACESNIAIIAQELEKFKVNDPTLNAFLICNLLDLEAVETIDVIERAFKGDRVDISITGDWEDVQVAFGLKTRKKVRSSLLSEKQIFDALFPAPRKTKVAKGFGSTQTDSKKQKSRKSSGKR